MLFYFSNLILSPPFLPISPFFFLHSYVTSLIHAPPTPPLSLFNPTNHRAGRALHQSSGLATPFTTLLQTMLQHAAGRMAWNTLLFYRLPIRLRCLSTFLFLYISFQISSPCRRCPSAVWWSCCIIHNVSSLPCLLTPTYIELQPAHYQKSYLWHYILQLKRDCVLRQKQTITTKISLCCLVCTVLFK